MGKSETAENTVRAERTRRRMSRGITRYTPREASTKYRETFDQGRKSVDVLRREENFPLIWSAAPNIYLSPFSKRLNFNTESLFDKKKIYGSSLAGMKAHF
jgi:hypothetical protein